MVEEILKKELGDDLKFNMILKDFVSIRVGGVADYFFTASSIEDLVLAVSLAVRHNIPYFILGGGYNVVPSDQGFCGLVIKNQSSNIVISPESSTAIVDSGVNINKLVNLAASYDLGGLEFLCGIPGTVGGAIYGNAGAFGSEIGDFVKSVTMLDPKDGSVSVVKRSRDWFNFSYRLSRLKNIETKRKPVILTATIQLARRRKDEILSLMQKNLKAKRDSQPLNELSAGSFFKNNGIGQSNAAGYLLDNIGAKKMRVGGAAFSQKHANFLINRKNATATDVASLAKKAKTLVKEKYNIELAEEVEYIGKW